MKRIVILFAALLALFLIFATERAVAQEQEKSPVKVKRSDVVTGVVIVNALQAGKPLVLQCNEGQRNCKVLKGGDYAMLELPKNYGMYDCKNVEIYRENNEKEEEGELVGEYCMVEK